MPKTRVWLTEREKEIVYFSLSREIDRGDISNKEFNEMVVLREKFKCE